MAYSVERRAHIARKLHYLDGMTAEAIAAHFEAENIASIQPSTVAKYFTQEPATETIEKVRERQADEDLRIAESQQRKHDRAREDEKLATQDEPIQRVVPETDYVTDEMVDERVGGFRTRDWRFPDPADGDWPEWAEPGLDSPIVFDGTEILRPGDQYPVSGLDGKPKYTTELAGLKRGRPDLAGRRSSRYEQKNHNEVKAQVLGIDEDTLNVDVGGSLDLDHTVPEDVVEAVVGASHSRLDSNADESDDDE